MARRGPRWPWQVRASAPPARSVDSATVRRRCLGKSAAAPRARGAYGHLCNSSSTSETSTVSSPSRSSGAVLPSTSRISWPATCERSDSSTTCASAGPACGSTRTARTPVPMLTPSRPNAWSIVAARRPDKTPRPISLIVDLNPDGVRLGRRPRAISGGKSTLHVDNEEPKTQLTERTDPSQYLALPQRDVTCANRPSVWRLPRGYGRLRGPALGTSAAPPTKEDVWHSQVFVAGSPCALSLRR